MRAIIFLPSLLLVLGCGSSAAVGPPPVPVSGVVTFNGKPLADAEVRFLPEDIKGAAFAKGKTDGSGNYKLKYSKGGDGAPPGKYKVVFSKKENFGKAGDLPPLPPGTPDEREDLAVGKELLPDRLATPAMSKTFVTVPEKGGTVDIELK